MRGLVTLGMLLAVLALPAGSQEAARGRVCGTLHASLPYTHRGSKDRWRVYVAGKTSCGAAEAALDAVMHLRAKLHRGSNEADTYSTYGAWRCPAGNMGVQECFAPRRVPTYAAQALAVDCTVNPHECSASKPPSWFPG